MTNLFANRTALSPRMAGLFRSGLDLMFPPRSSDGREAALSLGLAAPAWARVAFIDQPACDGCGLAFPHDLGAGARCPACLARPRAFSRARAACVYDEASRELILKLKHADRPDLAGLFALWLGRAAADLLEEADAVVPVPLHPWRLFTRRYNQAAEIARPLARASGLLYLPDALVRRRATASQGGKSGRGRKLNVAGAFAVRTAARDRLKGLRIVLVDDVFTTGATAEACAKALLAAGAARVDLAAVARVQEQAQASI